MRLRNEPEQQPFESFFGRHVWIELTPQEQARIDARRMFDSVLPAFELNGDADALHLYDSVGPELGWNGYPIGRLISGIFWHTKDREQLQAFDDLMKRSNAELQEFEKRLK